MFHSKVGGEEGKVYCDFSLHIQRCLKENTAQETSLPIPACMCEGKLSQPVQEKNITFRSRFWGPTAAIPSSNETLKLVFLLCLLGKWPGHGNLSLGGGITWQREKLSFYIPEQKEHLFFKKADSAWRFPLNWSIHKHMQTDVPQHQDPVVKEQAKEITWRCIWLTECNKWQDMQ